MAKGAGGTAVVAKGEGCFCESPSSRSEMWSWNGTGFPCVERSIERSFENESWWRISGGDGVSGDAACTVFVGHFECDQVIA